MGKTQTTVQVANLPADGWTDAPRLGESGASKVLIASAQPVLVPFRPNTVSIENNSGSVTTNYGNIAENEDKSNTGINISVAAGVNNGVFLHYPFTGSLFGVRWRSSTGSADFSVTVDEGDSVFVQAADPYLLLEQRTLSTQPRHLITHRDLDPTVVHRARIHVPSPATSTWSVVIHGVVLDTFGANAPATPMAAPMLSGTLTNAGVSLGTVQSSGLSMGLYCIHYFNTDSSARIVTLRWGGSLIFKKIYLAISGTTGDSATFFPNNGGLTNSEGVNSIQHFADAGSVVNYLIYTGN